MIQNNNFFNQFDEEFSWSGNESSSLRSYSYQFDTGYEIPTELYTGFQGKSKSEEKTAENKESDSYEDFSCKYEICSVEGEKKFNEIPQLNSSNEHSFNTEASLRKSSQDISYEKLFILIEDKKDYTIGNSDDGFTLESNNEIQNLSSILNNDQTNMNNFIGDMLKCCPSDSMIKKQRIYKAKNIKRKRKTKVQIKKLEKEFKLNESWEKEDFKKLSITLGLSRDQVYKWFWDQKNKKDY